MKVTRRVASFCWKQKSKVVLRWHKKMSMRIIIGIYICINFSTRSWSAKIRKIFPESNVDFHRNLPYIKKKKTIIRVKNKLEKKKINSFHLRTFFYSYVKVDSFWMCPRRCSTTRIVALMTMIFVFSYENYRKNEPFCSSNTHLYSIVVDS